MNNSFFKATQSVAKILNKAGIAWCVGASGALVLHGIPVVSEDLDVIVDPKHYEKAVSLLSSILLDQKTKSGKVGIDGSIDGFPTEILALPIDKTVLTLIESEGHLIPVQLLTVELNYYKARIDNLEINREKVRLIEQALADADFKEMNKRRPTSST